MGHPLISHGVPLGLRVWTDIERKACSEDLHGCPSLSIRPLRSEILGLVLITQITRITKKCVNGQF